MKTLKERIESESDKQYVNLRNSKELQILLHKAREILKIHHDKYGADPETVRKSLKFVIEFNDLFWEKFLNDYPPLAREIIKERLKS